MVAAAAIWWLTPVHDGGGQSRSGRAVHGDGGARRHAARPGLRPRAGAAGRAQPAVFSERAGGARPERRRRLHSAPEYREARELLREHTLALVGVQNAEPAQLDAAAAAGLASFAPNATQPSRRAARPPAPRPRSRTCRRRAAAEAPRHNGAAGHRAGAVGHPDLCSRHRSRRHRAGQPRRRAGGRRQHPCVWRAARPRSRRGRAATPSARIFCSRLEAELVSIAGRYLVSEQLPAGTAGFAGADRARR